MCEDPHEWKFIEIAFGWGSGRIWLYNTLEDPWPPYMNLEVWWDNLWTLSFEPSQFHGHGSWLMCKMALRLKSFHFIYLFLYFSLWECDILVGPCLTSKWVCFPCTWFISGIGWLASCLKKWVIVCEHICVATRVLYIATFRSTNRCLGTVAV